MTLPEPTEKRKRLLRWMTAGLAAVNPRHRVASALQAFDLNGKEKGTAVLALGKAAVGMARGAQDILGTGITSAMLIGPEPAHVELTQSWQLHRGDHPEPGEHSMAAGRHLRDWLESLQPDLHLLVLLSGGGSTLAELPVAGMTLADLKRVNRWLLATGLDVRQINAIRARFSLLKRGGLLRLAGSRRVTGLLISDVPGDRITDIASGPLSPALPDWPDTNLPEWLEALHAKLPLPPDHLPDAHADIRVVARNADALDAVAGEAAAENIPLATRDMLSGSAEEAGVTIGAHLREGPPGLYLYGGETSVRLPEEPGQGGRNQHLALAAAKEVAGCENIFVLSMGTDGIDGNTDDAGALIDGGTVLRIHDAGLDASDCLARADSNAALAAAGDVIHTGATGTNVADIVIGWKAT